MTAAVLLTLAAGWPTGAYIAVGVWQRYRPALANRMLPDRADWTTEIEEYLRQR